MKLSFLSLLYIGLFVNSWNIFSSEEGKFSILAPANLEEKMQVIHTELGEIEYYTFHCDFGQDSTASNYAYAISYCDYPVEMIPKDSIQIQEEFFHNSIQAASENLVGELIYSQAISKNGKPGRIARISFADGAAIMKTSVFLADNRFYSIQVFMTQENSLNKEADRFLNSFVFL